MLIFYTSETTTALEAKAISRATPIITSRGEPECLLKMPVFKRRGESDALPETSLNPVKAIRTQ